MHSTNWQDALNRTALLFSKTLDSGEIEIWEDFLEPLPTAAVDYAFQNWQRNGRFFPKPKDILEVVQAYMLDQKPGMPRYEHQGEGYGNADISLLWKLYTAKRTAVNRPLNDTETEECFRELDEKRGWAPAWRKK